MEAWKKEERVGNGKVPRGIWTVAFNAISGLKAQDRRDDGRDRRSCPEKVVFRQRLLTRPGVSSVRFD